VEKVLGKDFVWHSDIVKFERDFVAQVKSAKRLSKKGNYFYPIVFLEDNEEYVLMPEHDGIERVLDAAPLKTWLLFTATGSRSDADLVVEPLDDTPVGKDTPEKAVTYEPVAEYTYNNLFEAYSNALATAADLQAWFEEAFDRPLNDLDHRIATTLLIQQAQSRWTIPLSSMQRAAADDQSAELDATDSQIQEIRELLETRGIAIDNKDEAELRISDGLSREEAARWIAKLHDKPEVASEGKDPLPF
jgi:hypothetical protein